MSSPALTEQRLRIGIAGAGRVADVHHNALRRCADLAVPAAICDVRPDAVAARSLAWGIPGFLSLEAMLAGTSLDAVIVLLPHDSHLPAMRMLLARRLPVLLEKPLAVNLAEANEIVRLAEAAHVPVLVGHNGLFHPAFEQMVTLVKDGWVGRPLFGMARSLQWLDFKPWDFRKSRAQTGGGAWVDCAGHLVYRLNALLGEVEAVTGFTSHLARAEMEGEDTAAGVLRYRSGAIAQVMVSYGCKLAGYKHDWPSGCEQMLMLSGDLGAIEYHICPCSRLRLFSENPDMRPSGPDGWCDIEVPDTFEVSFERQMRHFLECVRSCATPRITPFHAARLLRTLLALYPPPTAG